MRGRYSECIVVGKAGVVHHIGATKNAFIHWELWDPQIKDPQQQHHIHQHAAQDQAEDIRTAENIAAVFAERVIRTVISCWMAQVARD